MLAEVAQVLSPINFVGKYKWAISNANPDKAKELVLTNIKKYWGCTGQVEIALDWLYD